MDSSRFSSPRSDCFPAGLRVLVVDDDPTWLKILEKMLKKCNYQVTTCNLMQEALDLLQERKDGFDIVISDVNMEDMDGFKLLEHVGLKMDLPVIMMSVDGETSRVMKGVQHGACDYLLKPIRMKELRNIWQHVFRKRIREKRDQESLDETQMMKKGTEQSGGGYLFGGDMVSGKKRKDVDNWHPERECGNPSSAKKARVVWTVDLHQKFVKAVNQIGFDKVGPKKILDLMGEPRLTRENVASHLQKYRLYLSRLEKENELKATSSGIKHSDISSKDPAGNIFHQSLMSQNRVTLQQNIIRNENYTPGHKIQIYNYDAEICEGNVKGVLSMPMPAEPKKALFADLTDPLVSCTSRISFNQSFGLLDSEVNSEPKIQVQYSWRATAPSVQFKQELEPHFRPEHQFDQLPLPIPHLSQDPRPSSKEADTPTEANMNPSYGNNRNHDIAEVAKVENAAALFSDQPQSHLPNCQMFKPIQCSMWSTKNHSLEQNLYDNLESSLKNLIAGTGSALRLWDEEFNGYQSQGDSYPLNHDLVNSEPFGYNNQEFVADVSPHLSDSVNFDSEYPSEPLGYPVMDQGLFIS